MVRGINNAPRGRCMVWWCTMCGPGERLCDEESPELLLARPEPVDGGGDEGGEEDAHDGAESAPHIRREDLLRLAREARAQHALQQREEEVRAQAGGGADQERGVRALEEEADGAHPRAHTSDERAPGGVDPEGGVPRPRPHTIIEAAVRCTGTISGHARHHEAGRSSAAESSKAAVAACGSRQAARAGEGGGACRGEDEQRSQHEIAHWFDAANMLQVA